MQKLKTVLIDYLNFGKRDRVGLVCLVGLIIIIYALPYLFARRQNPFAAKQTPILARAVDTLSSKGKTHSDQPGYEDFSKQSPPASRPNAALFRFDPNTISVEDWERLGLSEKTARTIEKYRTRGGQFRQREDLQRIWGLPPGFYERVRDYVTISSTQRNEVEKRSEPKEFQKFEKKSLVININEADTSAFIALPGIGSKLAQRIVGFRDKLGGFYSIEQIGETYGLQDSTFQKIKHCFQLSGPVKKLNVNTATKDELKLHPYIRWNLANAIIEYRNQHGPFRSVEELKNIALIDQTTFSKIIHYLAL